MFGDPSTEMSSTASRSLAADNFFQEYYNEAEARDVCGILLGAISYIHSQGIV